MRGVPASFPATEYEAFTKNMIDRTKFTPGGVNPAHPVPINFDQSVPTEEMVNLLARLCNLQPESLVVEIGTGSGYQAAVLAEKCHLVITVEVNPVYKPSSCALPANVMTFAGDGTRFDCYTEAGYAHADAVLVTFAAPMIYPAWKRMLRQGGRLVVPLQTGSSAAISVFHKLGDDLILSEVVAYAPFTAMKEAA